MKIKLDAEDIAILKRNCKLPLMNNDKRIFIIVSYKIEELEETKKSLFKKTVKTIKNKYLVEACIQEFHQKLKVLVSSGNDESWSFLMIHDIDQMRQNWLDFNKELQAFGFEVRYVKNDDI